MIKKISVSSALLLLLLAFLTQALSNARTASLTIDEGLHIASGYTILRTGDYRLVEEHPPLVKMWAALPLLPVRDMRDPTALPAWEAAATPTTESLPLLRMAQQLIYPYQPLDRLIFPARAMIALLGVVLLVVIFRWAKDLWGNWGALFAIALAAFDPNLIAHAAVAGTDLGAATLTFLTLFVARRFLRRPTRTRALLAGVTLALALTAKLSTLLLLPVLGLAGLMHWWLNKPLRQRLLRGAILLGGTTGLLFWAIYGFQVQKLLGLPCMLPAAYHAIPFMRLQEHLASGHNAFLLGQNSMHGWWYYFPVAFALKTPLPVLLLGVYCGLRIAYSVLRIPSPRPRRLSLISQLTFYAFPLFYALATLFSTIDIGYRHLLPLLPFLYVALGGVIHSQNTQHATRNTPYALRFTFYVLLIWLALGTLATSPHYLPFFNEIAGGADNGWRFLADSNTDWGQGYKELAAFQKQEKIDHFNLSAFIFSDPALYGVRYTPLTPYGGYTPAIFPSRFAPPAGDYAISATTLDGIPLADPEMYDWFRWREPDEKIAHALFYYHITEEETNGNWLAQCVTPTLPLNTETIQAGFGGRELRNITFNCTQSWIIPPATSPGYYALHGSLIQDSWSARLHYTPPTSDDTFIAHHLASTEITYRQRKYGTAPAFALYRATTPPSKPASQGVWAAPAATPPRDLPPDTRQQPPLALDGPLIYLGSQTTLDNNAQLEIESWWQVIQGPISRPLSIMAHLITNEGQLLEVADGLGVPPAAWQIGDIIIQRHRFTAHEGELYLRTGAYWRDDGARWSLATDPDADAIFIPLSAPEIP